MQRSLEVRGAVDFDDLIMLALQALRADDGYLARLQQRWPYMCSRTRRRIRALAQEKMLRHAHRPHGNWVRVGDTNQAINTTFTSADTRFLQKFLQEASRTGARSAQLGAQRAADHRGGQRADPLVAAASTRPCRRGWR
jgi:DNA helicase-2/ATP-dependent DNA helicase PcrA